MVCVVQKPALTESLVKDLPPLAIAPFGRPEMLYGAATARDPILLPPIEPALLRPLGALPRRTRCRLAPASDLLAIDWNEIHLPRAQADDSPCADFRSGDRLALR